MVSLRERRSRPSYSDIPEGPEDFFNSPTSASGEEFGAASSSDSGSGSNSQAGKVENEEPSLSSGGSSEFQPDEDEAMRARMRKVKGKGRATTSMTRELSNSDGYAEMDEPTSPTPLEPEDEPLVPLAPSEQRLEAPRPSAPAPRKSSAPQLHSDTMLLPAGYRELLKQSAARIAKAPSSVSPAEKHRLSKSEKYQLQGLDLYPDGPVTPFGTRLSAAPAGRGGARVRVVEEPEDTGERKGKRQRRAYQVGRFVPLLAPWEVWEGEGWWPEMYAGETSRGHGKGKGKGNEKGRKGWLMREEVRMGLKGVGRVGFEGLELLSEADADVFLPTPADIHGNAWITCHIGRHDAQRQVNVRIFDTLRVDDSNKTKEGFIFSAGGPIWGLDWCPYPEAKAADFDYAQYLAISALPHLDTKPAMGEKWPRNSPSGIQIWSMTPPADDGSDPGGMQCEMVLCVDGGPAMEVKWMPLGAWDEYEIDSVDRSCMPKIGILAAVQLDGSVSFYPVTHPKLIRRLLKDLVGLPSEGPVYVRTGEPLLRLGIPDAACSCIEWMTGSRIAVGLSNVLPAAYMSVAKSYIRSVAAGRCPPSDPKGQPCFGEDPSYLVIGSYDGSTAMVDLRDPAFTVELNRARSTALAVGWASQCGSPLYADVDYVIAMQKLRGKGAGRGFYVAPHRGPVWDIATSDYHTMAVSGGSDGSVLLSNFGCGFRRRRGTPLLYQRLYEMDYDLHTGEYRMTDDFLPETMTLETAAHRNLKKLKFSNDPSSSKTANWPPHVGVHRVSWHNGGGIGRAGLLASATASGLGRIDVIRGMFAPGKDPTEWLA